MLKKFFKVGIPFALLLGFTLGSAGESEAATKIVVFKNCTELNKVYKGGVARSASVKNKGGKTYFKPFVSQALYDANKKSDRDKDLIACER
ncbi:excalibur calcium-binding domain-containing protein [Neobacillus drentensis]|nr:excalibur calcium-binding domain-containing protein [Neobacillus drentensis]ULT56816.1 excalibur calcium-binding domain-containing protein [Neobacillus drentensis]